MDDTVILLDGLVQLLKKNSIGKSFSHPCGWITATELISIAEELKDGKIDKFGNIKE